MKNMITVMLPIRKNMSNSACWQNCAGTVVLRQSFPWRTRHPAHPITPRWQPRARCIVLFNVFHGQRLACHPRPDFACQASRMIPTPNSWVSPFYNLLNINSLKLLWILILILLYHLIVIIKHLCHNLSPFAFCSKI